MRRAMRQRGSSHALTLTNPRLDPDPISASHDHHYDGRKRARVEDDRSRRLQTYSQWLSLNL